MWAELRRIRLPIGKRRPYLIDAEIRESVTELLAIRIRIRLPGF